jgi:hypothetical protein
MLAGWLAGCTVSEQGRNEAPSLTIEDAKLIIVAARSAYWKDPDSIRDARIGKPYPCVGDLTDGTTQPTVCVCVEANAKTSLGGYTGLKQNIVYLSGGTVVDFRLPRIAIDRCEGLVPFPELSGKRS